MHDSKSVKEHFGFRYGSSSIIFVFVTLFLTALQREHCFTLTTQTVFVFIIDEIALSMICYIVLPTHS